MDWFLGVVGFEEEELGDDRGGHGFVDFAIEADDALLAIEYKRILHERYI